MVVAVTLLLGALLLLLLLFYRRRKSQLDVFDQLGIQGPAPHWFYTNIRELYNAPLHTTIQGWTKLYGKLYGFYDGACSPVLVTSDPEMVKQVFLKNFSNFHSRKPYPLTSTKFKHMFTASGGAWKRLRSISNPTFSTVKLKLMQPLMSSRVEILLKCFTDAAKSDTAVDVVPLYQGFTMDVIAATAFGMDIDAQTVKDEPFLLKSRQMFASLAREKTPAIVKVALLFPELRGVLSNVLLPLARFMDLPQVWLINNLKAVIEQRRKVKEVVGRVDLLQLMLDAEVKDDDLANEASDLAMTADDMESEAAETKVVPETRMGESSTSFFVGSKTLTNPEICAQSFLFLVAGYETTSTALSYATYLLALNPDKQDKLLEEIDNHLPDREKPTYANVTEMTYLHWVLCETLRMYPMGSNVVNRLCVEPCDVGGVYIPAGVSVQPDVWTIHYDPDLWGPTDPHAFEPERFRPELHNARHPMAWIPFGAGPRNCIGMRFALTEAKLALVRVLQNFTFQKSAETEVPLELSDEAVIAPKKGVKVKVISRVASE